MRIVGGTLSGRRFQPPAKIPARPTTDLAREGLFNILANKIDLEDAITLDLFGGTGGISYELASRGAATVIVIEQDTTSVNFIKKTIAEYKIEEIVTIIKGDVFRFLKTTDQKFDIIFADPPYALPTINDLPTLVFERNLLNEDGLFVLEHDTRNGYEEHPHFQRAKNYGDTIFTFFTAAINQ